HADRHPRRGAIDLRRGPEDTAIEVGHSLRRADRNIELDIGHAEIDAAELRRRIVAEEMVAPGADRLDMIIVLGEIELRSLEWLAQSFQPPQEPGAIGHDETDPS